MERWSAGLAACALAACSSGGDEDTGETFGLEERVPVSGLAFPTGLADPGPVDLVDAFPSLSFAAPVFLTHPPDGTNRVVVVEQGGTIRIFPNDAATPASSLFLDVTALVLAGGERGLLGFAFDPDYASNGRFYVYYSAASATPGSDHKSVIARYLVSTGDPNAADPASGETLLEIEQPFSNHNGGMLAFGPDDMLYVASGDGGSGGDPMDNAQDLTNLLGKILRITTDGGVPRDNPFIDSPGARGEIWAFGLRNPWRFSFDRATGALWCGDVGQNEIEEIDLVTGGANLGWDAYEGTHAFEDPEGLPFEQTTPPVVEYDHGLGASVTGGYVYRGPSHPALVGAYFYADFGSGRVWALVHDGTRLVSNEQVATVTNPASFGEDEAGELYVCSFDGRIYRLAETEPGPAPSVPALLSQTGLFVDTAALEPAQGIVEYDVNSPLWSDGAAKRRWIALPGTARIAFDATEAWSFPVGTVLVKHFEMALASGDTRRLETRALVHAQSGWQGYTYRWNEAQDDAQLLRGAASETLLVPDPLLPGGSLEIVYDYPSGAQCLECHTAAAGRVLGVRTRQLNRDFAYPATVDNQLRAWNHVGFFTADIGAPSLYDALPNPADVAAPVPGRARAYLDANCAMCHRPGGPVPVELDLRYGILVAEMHALLVPPSAGDLGLTEPYLIDPGSPETSILWERMRRVDDTRMPPLATNLVDHAAVALIGEWIAAGATD